jgi:hypothetical protein
VSVSFHCVEALIEPLGGIRNLRNDAQTEGKSI